MADTDTGRIPWPTGAAVINEIKHDNRGVCRDSALKAIEMCEAAVDIWLDKAKPVRELTAQAVIEVLRSEGCGQSWADRLASKIVALQREPVDNPAGDLIGTVRRGPDGAVYQRVAHGLGGWAKFVENGLVLRSSHHHVTGMKKIGTVPGTPAWEAEQRGSAG